MSDKKVPAHLDPIESGIWYLPYCMEMCPTEEVNMRTTANQVHVLEKTPSGKKLVKSYSWTVANTIERPRQLRPFIILYDTLHHLLLEVPKRLDTDFNLQRYGSPLVKHFRKLSIMYDFISDRLAAVRYDMSKQNLFPEEAALLLEPMIRFYVFFGYRLCDHPRDEYDPDLNRKDILECLEWFFKSCEALHKKKKGANIDEAIDNHKTRPGLECDINLMESLNLIYNLGDNGEVNRYLRLPKYLRMAPAPKLAYDITVANDHGNFIRVLALAKELCPITFCALCLHLPKIQKRGLLALSHGFHNTHRTVPVQLVKIWLSFTSYEEVRNTCAFYGLEVIRKTGGIIFNKNNFKEDMQHEPVCHFPATGMFTLEEVLSYTV